MTHIRTSRLIVAALAAICWLAPRPALATEVADTWSGCGLGGFLPVAGLAGRHDALLSPNWC